MSRRTVAGLRWSYVDAVANAAIMFAWTAASSRLLEPTVFGLVAVANLVVTFGMFFARMGVAQALVQKPQITRDDVRASLTSGTLTGLVCFGLLWLAAPAAAAFFNKPEVVPLLRILGLSFVVTGLGMTSQGLLRRALRFRELALIGIAANVVASALGIALALADAGEASLITYALSSTVVTLVLSFSRARHTLRPTLSVRPFAALYSFGARVSLIRFLEFWAKNLDTVIVGRYLSTAALGQYSRAYVLVSLPLNRYLASALTTVLFPAFSTIQTDEERLKRGFLSAMGISAVVLLPITAGMAVAAGEIVGVVLGPGWEGAARIVPLFALGFGFNILTRLTELLCEARAELNRNLALQIGYLGVLAVALLLAAPHGVVALAGVLLGGEIVRHVGFATLVQSLLQLRARDFWLVYVPAGFAAAVVGVSTAGARLVLLATGAPIVVILLGEVVAGGLGLAVGIRCNPVSDVRRMLAQRLRNAGLIAPDRALVSRVANAVLGGAA